MSMKKLIAAAAAVCAALSISLSVSAAETSVPVSYNGVFMDGEAEVSGGIAYMRYNELLNQCGASYIYSNAEGKLSAKKEDTVISLSEDSDVMTVNESGNVRTVKLSAAPKRMSGSFMVPLRDISEIFGCEVEWYEYYTKRTVYIFNQQDGEDEFNEKCPQISRILEISENLEDAPMQITGSLNLAAVSSPEYKAYTSEMYLDILADIYQYGSDVSADLTCGFYMGDEENSIGLSDITFEGVTGDDAVYIKTNIIRKLSEWMESVQDADAERGAAAADIVDNMWISIPNEDNPFIGGVDIKSMFLWEREEGAMEKGISCRSAIEIGLIVEKLVSLTQTGENTYVLDVNITNDTLAAANLIPEDALEVALEGTDICVSVVETIEDNRIISEDAYIHLRSDNESSSFSLFISSQGRPTEYREIELPESSVDIQSFYDMIDSM